MRKNKTQPTGSDATGKIIPVQLRKHYFSPRKKKNGLASKYRATCFSHDSHTWLWSHTPTQSVHAQLHRLLLYQDLIFFLHTLTQGKKSHDDESKGFI